MYRLCEWTNAVDTFRDGGQTHWVYVEDKVVRVVDKDVVREAVVEIEHHIVLVEQGSQPLRNLKNLRMIWGGFPTLRV